jgi:glycogen debranching enzyme
VEDIVTAIPGELSNAESVQNHSPDAQHILVHADRSAERIRSLKYGDTFAVFNHYGDMRQLPSGEEGLYLDGTRFLSTFMLYLDGFRPLILGSTVRDDNDQLIVTLTNPDLFVGGELHLSANSLHISKRIFLLDAVCYVEIRMENYSSQAVDPTLTLSVAADFKDIYEVRGMARQKRGDLDKPSVGDDRITLAYMGLDGERRITSIDFSPRPGHLDDNHATYAVSLGPRESATFVVTIACRRAMREHTQPLPLDKARAEVLSGIEFDKTAACSLQSSNGQFNAWINRSLSDLHMMITSLPTGPYPYAGVPWFNTPFGRDGIITAWECLWLRPDLARGVLAYLSLTQATEIIPEQDAEPGKILHETRNGEMAALKEMPFGLYYGSVDATPLFVALAGAYYEGTGDLAFIQHIWPNIVAALKWISTFGDKDRDGFIEYERCSAGGLLHQGWKDADDAVFHADGTPVQGAIAMCEVQGYVYAAYKAVSKLAKALGYDEAALEFGANANRLRTQFNKAFWCEELSTYAMALDGDKRPCRIVTSNAGQCLFTGIATLEHAQHIADTLLSDEAYSGWGVRTVSSSETRFNPMAYHNGSVWPHDNALIAYGMARYGLTKQANRVFTGLFESAMYFDLHRMPELFCGFSREAGEGPVLYPVACAPQAWSAASVFLLCQACLGVEVHAEKKQVRFFRPSLPEFLTEIHIINLQVGDSSIDIDVIRHGDDVGITVRNATNDLAVVLVR